MQALQSRQDERLKGHDDVRGVAREVSDPTRMHGSRSHARHVACVVGAARLVGVELVSLGSWSGGVGVQFGVWGRWIPETWDSRTLVFLGQGVFGEPCVAGVAGEDSSWFWSGGCSAVWSDRGSGDWAAGGREGGMLSRRLAALILGSCAG